MAVAVEGRRDDAAPEARPLGRILWILLGIGLAGRLLLAATTNGSAPDLHAFRAVHAALSSEHFGFYDVVNPDNGRFAWPYLPGYLPVIELLVRVEDLTGIAFGRLVRLPAIAADLAIAWVVQWHLGWRGASRQTRLLATAVLVFSPVGVALTGAHGQIDPLQWLPVVLAVVAWERLPQERRAVVAGLLIGLGLTIKPPAALAGLALFALASSWRERLVVAGSAAAIPVLAFAPFLLADAEAALRLLDYQSVPGQGGISLIVQPDLALARFAGEPVPGGFNGANDFLQDLAPLLVGVVALGAAALASWRRMSAPETIAALVLVVFVVSPNFLPPYLVWLIPFTVLAGWWRFTFAVLALSLLLLPFKYLPGTFVHAFGFGTQGALWKPWTVWLIYIPASFAMWALLAGRLAVWAGAAARGAGAKPPAGPVQSAAG